MSRAGRLAAVALLATGCGYTFQARPPLAGGVERLSVPVFENETPETEVGTLFASALADRARREDRLAAHEEGKARILGRVRHIISGQAAFPVMVAGEGLYQLTAILELRLVRGEKDLVQTVRVTEAETYMAGAGPEETEANRRRALGRLADRAADQAWAKLTAAAPESAE